MRVVSEIPSQFKQPYDGKGLIGFTRIGAAYPAAAKFILFPLNFDSDVSAHHGEREFSIGHPT